jgi:carbon monoxide dehydrogenase subunit G
MHLAGTREFDASREAVFAAVTDPHLIAGAIPALESFEAVDADHWTATAKFSIAPRLRLTFEVLERRKPEHSRLRIHGKSFGGSAVVDTSFDLASAGDGRTAMHYEGELHLSGLLGRIGEHALRPLAERQIEKLLAAIEHRASSE